MFQSSNRRSVFAAAFLASAISFPMLAAAQAPEAKPAEVKSWPKQGSWQTQLVRTATGANLCMLNALGSDPHPFGVSFIQASQNLAFMVDDRSPGLRYLPTMAVYVDGQEIATYPTFNDPPMTSTAPGESAQVTALMSRLAQGKSLKVEARRVTYSLPLDGFAQAAEQFAACRQEVAQLQGGTTGRGN